MNIVDLQFNSISLIEMKFAQLLAVFGHFELLQEFAGFKWQSILRGCDWGYYEGDSR